MARYLGQETSISLSVQSTEFCEHRNSKQSCLDEHTKEHWSITAPEGKLPLHTCGMTGLLAHKCSPSSLKHEDKYIKYTEGGRGWFLHTPAAEMLLIARLQTDTAFRN